MTHTHHPGLLHTFRLQMDGWHYTEVFIWDSPESMWASNPRFGKGYYGLATTGTALATATGNRIAHKFGELHLYQNGYNTLTVAHEIMHLLNYWVQRKRWDLDKHDERIACLCENLHKYFWEEHYKIYPS